MTLVSLDLSLNGLVRHRVAAVAPAGHGRGVGVLHHWPVLASAPQDTFARALTS